MLRACTETVTEPEGPLQRTQRYGVNLFERPFSSEANAAFLGEVIGRSGSNDGAMFECPLFARKASALRRP